MKRLIICFAILTGIATSVQAKTEKFGTWIELEFRKDFLKRFAFSISPELRLQDQFRVDEYLVQSGLSYEPLSWLEVAGNFRIGTEVKNKGNQTYYRYAFDMHLTKEIDRFEATFRGRYTNYADSGDDGPSKYFRPRIKLEYNIKGNKITPFTSYELFHNATEKELHKSRFDVGFNRDLGKIHRMGIYYRLHDYLDDKNSVHILGIEYRIKF